MGDIMVANQHHAQRVLLTFLQCRQFTQRSQGAGEHGINIFENENRSSISSSLLHGKHINHVQKIVN